MKAVHGMEIKITVRRQTAEVTVQVETEYGPMPDKSFALAGSPSEVLGRVLKHTTQQLIDAMGVKESEFLELVGWCPSEQV